MTRERGSEASLVVEGHIAKYGNWMSTYDKGKGRVRDDSQVANLEG